MSAEGLEQYSKDQLIEELINRQTFVGIVVFHRGDAKAGRLAPGEIVMTKSPPLTREGVEELLRLGESLVPGMFGHEPITPLGLAAALPLYSQLPVLRLDNGGVVRVGKSRISLDLVIEQYENGMTPEAMVRAYDTLLLADVYAVIAYYLQHRDLVRDYLKRRSQEAEGLQATIEAESPRIGRAELLERRSEKDRAPTSQ